MLEKQQRKQTKTMENSDNRKQKKTKDNNHSNVFTISSNIINGNRIQCSISNISVQGLLDTGADVSVLSEDTVQAIKPAVRKPYHHSKYKTMVGFAGQRQQVLGCIELPIQIGSLTSSHTFQIIAGLQYPVIIGRDFLHQHKAKIDYDTKQLSFAGDDHIAVTMTKGLPGARVKCSQRTVIPPKCEMMVPVKIPLHHRNNILLLEQQKDLHQHKLVGAACIIDTTNGKYWAYKVMNPNNHSITLKKGTFIAEGSPIKASDISRYNENTANIFSSSPSDKYFTLEECKKIVDPLGIKINDADLTEEQKQDIYRLIASYRDCFAIDMSELGHNNDKPLKIETTDEIPVAQRPYKTTKQVRDEIEKNVDEMLENGVIEPSTSEWQSPVVMARKKDGTNRFAIDYRALNKKCIPLSHPIANISEVLDAIGEAKPAYFTTLDMASGFWQFGLDKETKHKTAFVTHHGKWEFNRIPFGIKLATSAFQSRINNILRGLIWKAALVYIDDVVIFSQTWKLHLQHISEILDRLRAANLKLKPSKCHFARKKVRYLGHYITPKGVEVDEANTEALKTFPTPTNVTKLRSFLGLCNFYRKFVPNFSKIVAPLNQLLRKGEKFHWNDDHDAAFKQLKEALLSPELLTYPDPEKDFILRTDASKQAVGYVLSQLNKEGDEKVIAFGGHSIRKEQKNYSATKLEMLAVKDGLRTYHHLLANSKIDIYTDHSALKPLLTSKRHVADRAIQNWINELQGYNFEVHYIQGKKNLVPDALSRREYNEDESVHTSSIATEIYPSIEPTETWEMNLPDFCSFATNATCDMPSTIDITAGTPATANLAIIANVANGQNKMYNLADEQKNCPEIGPMYKYLTEDEVPHDKVQARKLAAESVNYYMHNNILHHIYESRGKRDVERIRHQVVVPKDSRHALLAQYHDSIAGGGHQGLNRTFENLKAKYFWPKMYEETSIYVKSCDACQKAKSTKTQPAPLKPLPVVGPFERWHIDYLGPLTKTVEGYQHALLVIDSFSKFPEIIPMKSVEAKPCADAIFREVISRYGAPSSLVSDRGKAFLSKIVAELCKMFQIKQSPTSPYHPESNAACERTNSVIGNLLRSYCQDNPEKWPQYLPAFAMAFRRTPATNVSKFSPFQLLFGRDMKVPADLQYQAAPNTPRDVIEHMQTLSEVLRNTHEMAEKNIKLARDTNKEKRDSKLKATEPKYNVGDTVLFKNPAIPKGKCAKLHIKNNGPYIIDDKTNHNTYRVRHALTGARRRNRVSGKLLKQYNNPGIRQYPSTSSEHNHQDINEVANDAHQQESAKPPQDRDPSKRYFNKEEIVDVLKCVNKIYQIKLKSQRETIWVYGHQLPDEVKIEFHRNKTLTGKVKKSRKRRT